MVAKPLRVHVVGLRSKSGLIGGFDWFYDEAEATRYAAAQAEFGDWLTRLNLGVVVPDEIESSEITEWLDANGELWEVQHTDG